MKTCIALVFLVACGSTTSTIGVESPPDASVDFDATHSNDGRAPSDGAGIGLTLRVKNFNSGCNVSVNGGAPTNAAIQEMTVAPNAPSTTVDVAASPSDGFEIGARPWHGTAGDTNGAGDPNASTYVAVPPGGACVWVCCPLANGTGCPTTDQCP